MTSPPSPSFTVLYSSSFKFFFLRPLPYAYIWTVLSLLNKVGAMDEQQIAHTVGPFCLQ